MSKYPCISSNSCEICKGILVIKNKKDFNKRFCSTKCVSQSKRVKQAAPNCKICGIQISIMRSRDYNKIFCSRQCSGKSNLRSKKVCLQCKENFQPKYSSQKICSYKCMGLNQKSTYTKTCPVCRNPFILSNKAYERRGEGKYCSTKCSHIANKKYQLDEDIFAKIDSSEKAYWLGFLFADGYQNNQEIVLNISTKDLDHVEKFKSFLNSTHPIKINSKRNIASFRVSSKKMCDDLQRVGCVKAKTFILEPPSSITPKLIPDFIRGYFDGDGCIYVQRRGDKIISQRVSIHCASPSFRDWLIKTIIAFGIEKVTNPPSQEGRNISISNKKDILAFKSIIYSNSSVHLERKYIKFLD